MTLQRKLKGIIVALFTPVTSHGNVDHEGLERLTEYVIDGGVSGIFVMGSMGGSSFYNREEKLAALKTVADTAAGRAPVLFGVIENSTKEALKFIDGAEENRADALVLTAPGYFNFNETQLISYFRDIAQATSLPVYLYNRPPQNFTKELIEELKKEENIVGIKDSSSNFLYFLNLLATFVNDDDFSICQGDECMIAQSLISGADGAIVGTANVAPKLVVDIYEAVLKGDYSLAIKLQQRWTELWKVNFDADMFAGQAGALELLGICERYVQKPMQPATDEQMERIRERMIAVGALNP